MCSEGIGTPGMTLYDCSFTGLFFFFKNFLKSIANTPIDEVLQESFLQSFCADVNVEEVVEEIVFPYTVKV